MRIHGIDAMDLTQEVMAEHIDRFLEMEPGWVKLGEEPWTAEQFLEERLDKWRLSSYAQLEHRIIGYTIASRVAADRVYLHKILVDDEYRGKGAGALLFADLVRKTRLDMVPSIRFKSHVDNVQANGLYKSYGCTFLEKETSPDGVERYNIDLALRLDGDGPAGVRDGG